MLEQQDSNSEANYKSLIHQEGPQPSQELPI